MKRIHLLMVGAVVALFTLMSMQTATAACYLLGEVNGNVFESNVGVELTQGTGEVYTGTCEITGNGYFSIATGLAPEAGQWENCTGRFGAEESNKAITVGFDEIIVEGENSFKATPSKYRITVDLDNKSILLESTTCYVIGEIDGHGWVPNLGTKLTETGENTYIYSGLVNINNDGYIGITKNLGDDGDDWTNCNSQRYGLTTGENVVILENNKTTKLVKSTKGFKSNIGGGTVRLTVNFNDNSIKLEKLPVPELKITPAIGSYATDQKVTISCTNDSNAKIYYTLDGSTPDKTSTEYTAPFELADGDYTLKVVAYRQNNGETLESLIYTTKYYITSNPEPITINVKVPTDWAKANIHAWNGGGDIFDGVDFPGKTMTQMEGYPGWYTYTFDETVKDVNFIVSSDFGSPQSANTNDIIKSTNFEWDGAGNALKVTTEEPVFTDEVYFAPISGEYNAGEEISIHCGKAGAEIYYSINGGEETLYTEPFILNKEGEYTISAYNKDDATSTVTATYNIIELITVYFYKDPEAWSSGEGAKIFAWCEDGTPTDMTWANCKTMVKRGEVYWYEYTFPREITDVNVIFRNYDGSEQTMDVMHITESCAFAIENSVILNGEENSDSYGYVYTVHEITDFEPNDLFTALPSGAYEVGQKVTFSCLKSQDDIQYTITKDGVDVTADYKKTKKNAVISVELDEEGVYEFEYNYKGIVEESTYTIKTPITVYFYSKNGDPVNDWRIYSECSEHSDNPHLFSTSTKAKQLTDNDAFEAIGNNWYKYTFPALEYEIDICIEDANKGVKDHDYTTELTNIDKTIYCTLDDNDDHHLIYFTDIIIYNQQQLDDLVDNTYDNKPVTTNVTIASSLTDGVLDDGVYFEDDKKLTFEKDAKITIEKPADGEKAPTYKLPTVALNDGSELNADGIENLTAQSLEIIKIFDYGTVTNPNKMWFSLGLPFEVEAGTNNIQKLVDGTFTVATANTDFATFDYNGERRLNDGATGFNWDMLLANSGNIGEVIQLPKAGVHTFKFIAANSDVAIEALTNGREGDKFYDAATGNNEHNGWNVVPAGKTYSTSYTDKIAGVTISQEFDGATGGFKTGLVDATYAPGTVFTIQLTEQSESYINAKSESDAKVETYGFKLIDNEGNVIDRIYLFDGSNQAQYRVGKMGAFSASAPQMCIQTNGKNYCAYSSLASDTDKSYTVSLVNIPEGSQLVMTQAGANSVTIDDAATTLDSAIDVANGNINITIGSQTSSVDDAAAAAKVYVANGAIIIEGANGAYSIINMSGVAAATGLVEGNTAVNVPAGIYVVNVAGKYTKVIVK